MNKVIIVGSINQDIVIESNKIPNPGETVFGNKLHYLSGGKGVNQAIAANKFCKSVFFCGKVGDDVFGSDLVRHFESFNLNFHIDIVKNESTGTAIINVDPKGENAITLVKGANDRFGKKDLSLLANFMNSDYLLLQNEINQEFNHSLIRNAHDKGIKIILNPAPSYPVPFDVISKCDTVIVNEHELQEVFRLENFDVNMNFENILKDLSKNFNTNIVLTLGDQGSVACINNTTYRHSGHPVNVIDTTGAGDCFCGVYTAVLSKDSDANQALIIANKAASISVTKLGANNSYPEKHEI